MSKSNVKEKSVSGAMRIKPEILDNNDKTFWKLKSYNSECVVSQNPFA